MTSRAEAQITVSYRSWICDWGRSALQVWEHHELWSQVHVVESCLKKQRTQIRVTLFYTINPFGPSAGRVSRVCLDVFFCHVVRSALWRRGYEGLIFSKRLGLIALLRESMSQSNPSSRSASPKVEEKTLLLFSSCSMSRKGLSWSGRHFKPIPLAKDLHQVMKPKHNGTWDATDIPKRRIKHQPFHHCLSRFFTSADDLQCFLERETRPALGPKGLIV